MIVLIVDGLHIKTRKDGKRVRRSTKSTVEG